MKNLLISLFAVVFLAGCCSVQSEGQSKRKCTSQGKKSCQIVDSGTTFAKETFQQYIDSGEIPGVVCVFYDNGVQETACLGYADFRDKRPITMDDVFQQCSQTKGFCGVTIAMLVEEGKLSLDDPVSKYLPEYKELWIQENNEDGSRKLVKAKNTLTVRMCLNHTGGFGFELPNWTNMGGWSRRMPLRSVAAMAAAFPLRFEPGTKAQYSNVGIDVGAAIVEVVSGQRWEQFLQERIFDPLGMTSSTFWPTDEQLARKVEIFRYHQGEPATWEKQDTAMQQPYNDDRVFPSAGAGLWTNVRDQLKFYKMLMNLGLGDNGVRILKEETVKNILAVSTRPEGMDGYSLGLFAPVVDGEAEWFGHGGAWNTKCFINWHRHQLKLLAVQAVGGGSSIVVNLYNQAADKFFKSEAGKKSEDAYTGRMN